MLAISITNGRLLAHLTNAFFENSWIGQNCGDGPDLDESDKFEITKSLYPPKEWIDQKFMSSL